MSDKLDRLAQQLEEHLGSRISQTICRLGELTIEVASADYLAVAHTLRDHPALKFEQLIDLSGKVNASAW